jgi:hypothetical protein
VCACICVCIYVRLCVCVCVCVWCAWWEAGRQAKQLTLRTGRAAADSAGVSNYDEKNKDTHSTTRAHSHLTVAGHEEEHWLPGRCTVICSLAHTLFRLRFC